MIYLLVLFGPVPIWGEVRIPSPAVVSAKKALSQLHSQGFDGSVLIACGDQTLLHEIYGLDLGTTQVPSYWVASITKQFTAAAMLKMIDESDLKLQTRLAEILEKVPRDKANITLHQLLSHQSGLPQAFASSGVTDREVALAAILGLPLERDPGSGFGYSNDGYTLLAIIMEEVAGASYETLMKQFIIDPAELGETAFWPQIARQHEVIPPLISPLARRDYVENWDFRGATGMRLSVEDLHRWVVALDRGRVLNEGQREQLLGPHVTSSSGIRVGYNWFWEEAEDGRRMLWTRGQESFGANTVVYLFPGTDLIVIAATHSGPTEQGSGPVTGWSRRVRDQMIAVFDQNACAGSQPLFSVAGP